MVPLHFTVATINLCQCIFLSTAHRKSCIAKLQLLKLPVVVLLACMAIGYLLYTAHMYIAIQIKHQLLHLFTQNNQGAH